MSRIRNWITAAGLLILCLGLAMAQDQSKHHGAADETTADQTTLNKLDVVHGRQDISIEITASAPITPKVTTLTEPDRVVLDFPNTVPTTETRHINVDSDGIKSVRLGVNGEVPPTTRVVVDLEQARDYQLLPEANHIVLRFRNMPGGMTAEKPASAAVVPVASKTSESSKPAANSAAPRPAAAKTMASLNAGPLPAPAASTTAPGAAPKPASQTSAPSAAAAPAKSGKEIVNITTIQKPAPSPAPAQNPAPTSTAPAAASTTQPKSSSTPAEAEKTTTVASAQPAPAADPVPADTPDTTKADKGKAAPEMKKTEYDPNSYIIGEQDVLGIDVWREKEVSATVVVRPDGKITIPLVGEVYVVGLTPVQLQSLLEDKLKPFLTVPEVTVMVKEISSRRVYLMGQGTRNGPFLINSTTTVLQLLAQAGGLGPFAKRKKIYIMRNENGVTKHYRFNYDEVLKGKHLEQNIVLRPGDIVVVP